ncbi:MAG: hypothetical protein KatS3mg082_2643 [Nitrospiraceae bacterium]|nr:MAG: hypothetical protein KatS3mg082_2643 [Nitrospiraceae bacterium]
MQRVEQARERPCPVCSACSFEPFRFGLLRCAGCGLVVNPAIFRSGSGEVLNEEAFGEGWEPETSFWVRWFQISKSRRYVRTIRRYVPRGRLLEVGVGSGRFLGAARAAGFEVTQCDLSPAVCRRVEEGIGVHVHCGTVDSLPKGSFDVVAMHHVLEHVEDPVGFLRSVSAVLVPGGIAHIAVPNGASWEARFSGWNCYVPYHLTYFDPVTLARAARAAELVPVRMATHESFSTWFLLAVRTLLGIEANRAPDPGKQGSPWWPLVEHPYRLAMLMAGAITWPLRRVQSVLGRGDELIMVARAGA